MTFISFTMAEPATNPTNPPAANKSQDADAIHAARDEILKILNTPSHKRTSQDVVKLMHHTKDAKFFKELTVKSSPAAHLACCQNMFYEFCQEGEYIVRYGEKGTKFYIIISGRIGVQIPIKNEKTDEADFVEVIQLGDGAAFGELALEDNKPRAASIQCKIDTHFAVLDKADYKRILAQLVKEKRMEVVNFLQTLPMFKTWTKGSLTKLSFFFKEKFFVRKQLVFKEKDSSDEVYIIRDGEFQFYKNIRLEPQANFDFVLRKVSNMLKKDHVHRTDLAILSKGEIFGEDEVIHDVPRNTSCLCISMTASVLYLSKSDFLKRIKNDDSWKYIKERLEIKKNWVNNRLNYATQLEEYKTGATPRKSLIKGSYVPAPLQAVRIKHQLSFTTFKNVRSTSKSACLSKASDSNNYDILYKQLDREFKRKVDSISTARVETEGSSERVQTARDLKSCESYKRIKTYKTRTSEIGMTRSKSSRRLGRESECTFDSPIKNLNAESPVPNRSKSSMDERPRLKSGITKSPTHSPKDIVLSPVSRIKAREQIVNSTISVFSVNAFPLYQGLWDAQRKMRSSIHGNHVLGKKQHYFSRTRTRFNVKIIS